MFEIYLIFGIYLMDKIEKPLVIPIFIPSMGCPHLCAFCNQTVITRVKKGVPSAEQFRSEVDKFLGYNNVKKRKPVQIAFYGGNFLGLEKEDIIFLLHEAAQFIAAGTVDSIRFSTRPDTIDNDRIDIIKDFPVSTVEIGVQSMDDEVLAMANRGHTSWDTEKAAYLLNARDYEMGMQMMVGLPGDDAAKSLATGHKIAALSPDFVRIYPTVILKDSLLAKWYRIGKYSPLSLESCVTLVKNLYLLFRKKEIPVIRMGLQVSENFEDGATMLAGPFHPAFGHLVYSEIFLDKVSYVLESDNFPHKTISIRVHPRSISKMRGLKNKNIEILKNKFHINSIKIVPDSSLSEEASEVSDSSHSIFP